MSVFWTRAAEQDLSEIVEFIALDNPLAAIEMDELILAAANRLSEQPLMGKAGRIAGTRELVVHQSYRLIYETHNERVWVLAVVHTARKFPL
jgi:addiction module RelE/StbE family toxin